MNISIKRIVTAFLLLFFTSFTCVMAQKDDSGATFTVQGDFLSSYLWRGFYQTGASFQPTLAFSVAGFSLTAWGSTDFDGYKSSEGAANKEIDLTAAYTFGNSGLTLSIADLWWPDRARTNTSTSKAMKPLIISRPDWLIRFPWRNFPSPLPGIPCLPDRIRTRTAIRTILPTSNSIIRSA